MKSFDLHFSRDGKTKIDNIQNVNGNECTELTKNYIEKINSKHHPIDQILINTEVNIDSLNDII